MFGEVSVLHIPSDKHFIHGSIFMLANRLQTIGDRISGEITSKQWFLLMMIGNLPDDPAISRVAQTVGSSRQNTAKMLGQLEKKGCVVLQTDPQDHRSRTVRLTEKSRDLLAQYSRVGARFIDEMFEGVSDEQISCTKQVILQLFDNMEAMEQNGEEK